MFYPLKNYFLLIIIIVQSSLFAKKEKPNATVHYDKKAYTRLIDFGKGNDVNSNSFKDENLKAIILEKSSLSNIIFDNNNLDYSRFIQFSFKQHSKILNSELKETVFRNVLICDSIIKNSKLINTKIWDSAFDHSLIFRSDFSNATILNCRFANMREDDEDGKKCFMSNNNFNFATIKACTFKWVGINNNNFTGARIENTSFKKCFIIGANFSEAVMHDVIFEKCIFIDCSPFNEIIFTNNVTFNFCEFINTKDKDYAKTLIPRIQNLGATVIKKPGTWKKFKIYAGAILRIAENILIPALSGISAEYARAIISDCNRLCTMDLAQRRNIGIYPIN